MSQRSCGHSPGVSSSLQGALRGAGVISRTIISGVPALRTIDDVLCEILKKCQQELGQLIVIVFYQFAGKGASTVTGARFPAEKLTISVLASAWSGQWLRIRRLSAKVRTRPGMPPAAVLFPNSSYHPGFCQSGTLYCHCGLQSIFFAVIIVNYCST